MSDEEPTLLADADAQDSGDERRQHRRVEIPMLAELRHPALRPVRCLVENVSAGGAFLRVEAPNVSVGSKANVQLLNTSAVEQEPTPTVAMKVARVTPHGLGLAFANASARHLWESAERRRRALTVGQDYFQVHINLVVMAGSRMLLLMNRGRWVLPNFFLQVGTPWRDVANAHLRRELGLAEPTTAELVAVENTQVEDVPETATFSVYQRVNVSDTQIEISRDSGYSEHRWIAQVRKLRELTTASGHTQRLLEELLSDSQ